MKTVVLTLVAAVVLVAIGAYSYIYSGAFAIAAIQPDNPIIALIIHQVSDRAVGARLSENKMPDGLDKPELIASGAKLYSENCAVCHSGPGLKPTKISMGLNPSPPNLFTAGRHADPAEQFWFIKNGVKMTAMPGFAPSLSDNEIWSLAAFIKSSPGITPEDFTAKTGLK
ncbi:MAG: cytochrome c [Pseudomonadota bacterium]|nr:cytochrome c [Pseudomonadota bacterium]